MSLFKKFFLDKPSFAESTVPVITLLFAELPRYDLASLLPELEKFEPLPTLPQLKLEQDWQQQDMLLATLIFGAHAVDIASFGAPVPKAVLDATVIPSHWGATDKNRMLTQRAHLVLSYSGASRDAVEQYLALYKVAALFVSHDGDERHYPLGLLNEPAWGCHPAAIIPRILEPEMLPICRQSPPMIFWSGFLKLDASLQGSATQDLWYLSRGHHLFGMPDLSMRNHSDSDGAAVQNLFHELFQYFYFENKDIQAGDFIRLEEQGYFALLEGNELSDIFGGPSGILIVRPTTEAEIEALEN